MPPKVVLEVVRGEMDAKRYEFAEREVLLVGRLNECQLRVPEADDRQKSVSRWHCVLDINPPNIFIRDCGSRNGTLLNGKLIGQRAEGETPEEGRLRVYPEYALKDQDEVSLADAVTLRIRVETPLYCKRCGKELAESEVAKGMRGADACCSECLTRPVTIAVQTPVGQLGNYQLFEEVGAGSFGRVFHAREKGGAEDVAIKVYTDPKGEIPAFRLALLNREVENMKALTHPNIVSLIEAASNSRIFFLVMEYCNAGTLDSYLKKHGPLSLEKAMPIFNAILDALEYAHQVDVPYIPLQDGSIGRGKGLVHRDIKPANILLHQTRSGLSAKLADFGQSKAFEQAGHTGNTVTGGCGGTLMYMSRVQLTRYKYAKPEVDVWSAAATLYYMLTLQSPRTFSDASDPVRIILDKMPDPIRNRNPNIPKAVADVIDRALVDKPEIGIKSAAELKQQLHQALRR